MEDVHALLKQLFEEGHPVEHIRSVIEPKLASGCKLSTWSDTCVTSSGTSGYKECGQISGCDDASNNSSASCGGCQ